MEFGRWIAFFMLNVFIFVGWYGLLDRRIHTVSTRLLMVSVLSSAQIISSIFLLGLPWARLTAVNLTIVNTGLSGALLVFASRRRDVFGSFRELGRALKTAIKTIRAETILKILAVLSAATLVWIVFLAVLYPPIEWDSLMYHLPSVGHYVQQQSLADPPLPMDVFSRFGIDGSVWVNAFPKNIELLFLWAIIIPGSDTLVDLVEMIFGLVGTLAVYVLARRLGVIQKWAIFAAFIFLLTPIVIAQSRSNQIDLSNCALILVALALLFPGKADRRFDEVIISGIAVGIVLGAKWSGLMFLPVLWLMLIGQRLHWNYRDRLPKFNKLVHESGLFLSPALLFGVYWYAKNWYMYGNPLWPFRISFLGVKVFDGLLAQKMVVARTFPEQLQGMNKIQMLLTSWREPIIYGYDYDMKLGGLGPFWFIFAIPALYYLSRWIIRRRDVSLALIFLAAALMVLLHPENWWSRYTLFIAGLGAVAFAKIRSANDRPETTRLVDILVVITIIYSTAASWTTSYYQPAKVAQLLAERPELRTSASIRPEMVSQAYDHITKQTLGKPANIAYGSGLDFTYPLWGSFLQNKVYYIAPLDLPTWVRKLRERKIKYLLIEKDGPEDKLARKSSLFNQTFLDERRGYVVYTFDG